jgi:hypothetical protein
MTFQQAHPDFARIEAHIRRARAERSLIIGEAIGEGLIALAQGIERVWHGWRALFVPRARKTA